MYHQPLQSWSTIHGSSIPLWLLPWAACETSSWIWPCFVWDFCTLLYWISVQGSNKFSLPISFFEAHLLLRKHSSSALFWQRERLSKGISNLQYQPLLMQGYVKNQRFLYLLSANLTQEASDHFQHHSHLLSNRFLWIISSILCMIEMSSWSL